MFPVTVSGALAWCAVGVLGGVGSNKCDGFDIFFIGPFALDGDQHVIPIDRVGIVLWMGCLG